MRKLFGNKAEVTDVVAQEATVHEVNTNPGGYARLGWWIVLGGFGGSILWSTLAPLDKGVPVPGTVMVATNRKAVQHQSGGIVDDILVKEGDVVKAGQVLVKLNDVQAKAQAEMSRGQYFTDRAVEARLIAERDGKKEVVFPPELKKAANDPRVANNISLQKQLFSSRVSAIQNELAGIDENIVGLKDQVRGLEESQLNKKQQLVFLKEQLDGMRDLAKDGYIARNRLLDLERTYAQLNGDISEGIGNIARAHSQISQLSLQRVQRQQEYQRDVRSQLSDVQKEAESLASRLASQDFDLDNVLVRAPVAGTVVGMAVFTRGGVVGSGFRMMDIVPSEDPLIIEGQVPVNLVDQVHKDLPVELMFSALNQSHTPRVPGIVTQVSADRLTDEKTGQPYYKIQAKVTPEGKKMIASLQIRPGMSVEVFVKTGERTLASYLLKPVFDRADSALTEE